MPESFKNKVPVWVWVSGAVSVGTLLAVFFLWFSTIEYVERQEADAIASQASDNLNVARTLGEHLQRALSDIDLQSRILANEVRNKGLAGLNLRAFHENISRALPFVFQVTTNDAEGNNVSVSRDVPRINISDREHFAVHRDKDTDAPFIGRPVKYRTSGRIMIPVTHRLKDWNGHFAGVLTVAVDPEYFARFYASVIGTEDTVSAVRNDGVVIASAGFAPDSMNPGDDVSQLQYFQAGQGKKAGFFASEGTLAGTRWVVGFEAVGAYPVTIFVSTRMSAALSPVARSKRMGFSLAALVTLVLVAAGGLVVWTTFRQAKAKQAVEAGRQHALQLLYDKKQAEHALRENEQQLRTLSRAVEQSPSSIVITDREGRIEYVNPQFEKVTGYTRAEALGRNPSVLKSGTMGPEVYEQLWKAISTGGEWRGELCNRAKNGALFWEYAAISGLKGVGGEIEHYIAVKEDITLRKRAEESRLQSQKLESLGTLAGGIAHDFNNVLVAVNSNAELALEDLAEDHPARESVVEIARAGVRAADLVRRIVAFGRPQETKRKAIALEPVVEEALKLLRPLLSATIRVTAQLDAAMPLVSADASQVHEAIVNLATNSSYAIGARPGRIDISLKLVQVGPELAASVPGLRIGRQVRLSLRDDGCGMDPATLARIFDAFYTTKPVGIGTGLGLAMVHGIMKSHGGAIVVDSEPGKGSTFHLYFPVAEGAADAKRRASSAQVLGPGRRVMYVDDEEALVFLATRVLTRLGHQVTGLTDPVEAAEQFQVRPDDFDVVVTDLSMPRMSGYELARQLLAVRRDIPVIITTGYVRDEDQDKAREIGIRELVLKPNTVNDLGQILDGLFNPPHGLQ